MLEQEKPRRKIAERIRKKEPKPKKAKTPKKREACRVEAEPGESRIMLCPGPMLVTAPGTAGGMAQITHKAGVGASSFHSRGQNCKTAAQRRLFYQVTY